MWLTPWKSSLTEQELDPRELCAAPDEGLFWAVGWGGEEGADDEEWQDECSYNNKVPDSFKAQSVSSHLYPLRLDAHLSSKMVSIPRCAWPSQKAGWTKGYPMLGSSWSDSG